MKQFKNDAIIFIVLLILSFIVLSVMSGLTAIDIQLHDTYFVLDPASLFILIMGPLMFLIFLARGINRKFKTIGANIGLVIGLILVALITYYFTQLLGGYSAWVLFAILIIGLLLLIFRTAMIWKEASNSDIKE